MHVGDGKEGIKPLLDLIEDSSLPMDMFVPTHLNRNKSLFNQAVEHVRKGGYADFTAGEKTGKGYSIPDVMEILGEDRFRADQIFRWIHCRRAARFAEMTDLSKDLRALLERVSSLGALKLVDTVHGEDSTVKLAFRTEDGHVVESVLIPEGDKKTLCISSQVGCALGCRFCATARLGLRRNLTAGEITDQVLQATAMADSESSRISNLVYMGMGEPLANYDQTVASLSILMHPLGRNYSSRRITLSTAGHLPGLQRLSHEPFQINLAVSLNATTDETRMRLMPAARKWKLDALFGTLKAFPLERRRRITFEYVLISGINDRVRDAHALASLLRDIPAKVNLIALNPFPGCGYESPDRVRVRKFLAVLRERGKKVTLRKSLGCDILAACGQLGAKQGKRGR